MINFKSLSSFVKQSLFDAKNITDINIKRSCIEDTYVKDV